jgi:glutamate carboxypeptidase
VTETIPQREKIHAHLDSNLPFYFDQLRQMVEINSFTSNRAGVNELGDFTARLFTRLEFQSEKVRSANPQFGDHLFLYKPAKTSAPGRTIAMISHLDTVFSPEEEIQNDFVWRREGDRIYGPGVVDIKGGTTMIYAVLDTLKNCANHVLESNSWMICVDASEETLSDDFSQEVLGRLPSNTLACLVFEGGTPSESGYPIVVARKGRATFRVQVQGRSAHAGNYHSQGANAIVQMAHTIQEIASFTDYNKAITFNVGTVRGGSVVNRIPHFAEAEVEMRAFSPAVFDEGVARMLALDGTSDVVSGDGFPCRTAIHPLHHTNPWPRNPETDALFQIWQDTSAALGFRIIPEERGGLSDGNMLWSSYPTLDGLGPSGAYAHCSERTPDGSKDQEFLLASSFVPKALIDTLAILRLLDSDVNI